MRLAAAEERAQQMAAESENFSSAARCVPFVASVCPLTLPFCRPWHDTLSFPFTHSALADYYKNKKWWQL